MEIWRKLGGLMGSQILQPCLRILLIFLLFCCLQAHLCFSADTISPGQSLTGSQTITSSGGVFELGFFSLGNPSRYYIGIRYKEIQVDNVVWVANRDKPLQNNSAEFKVSEDGNLVIHTQSKSLVWSTNLTSTPSSSSRAAVLLDSGNLVMRDGNSSGSVLWDSFGHPTNTLLPGGRVGLNKATKQNQFLTSWNNKQDPSPGPFSLEIDPNGTAQFFVVWNKTHKYWTSGVWDGHIFSEVPEMRANYIYNFNFNYVSNEMGNYFTYSVHDSSMLTKFVMDLSGQIKQMIWAKEAQQWGVFWAQPREQCAVYALCGAFGVCNYEDNQNPCECIDGFKPASTREWGLGDWSGGCVRKTELHCGGDQFSELPGMRPPENPDTVTVGSAEECKSACLEYCSCTAFSQQGSRCSTWRGNLLNLQRQSDGSGDSIYVRLASLEPASVVIGGGGKKNSRVTVLLTIILMGILCAAVGSYSFWMCKAKMTGAQTEAQPSSPIQLVEEGPGCRGPPELPLFELRDIIAATNNFSESNKLGQGGFGSVYIGMLAGEQEVAVKRLSKTSKQGFDEFMNEVKLIAKLQHRNLVQLLGCCIEGEEKILVYEYMPNKSLDTFLFDSTLSRQLDWEKRLKIVIGIARGLQYLHQESRLRVIHRDLKASNILLDGVMNPKISDFGLARIFDGDQNQVSTNRVAGTYGYMSPEYALAGHYSTKSDIFSFGVIVLEIVSGRKMTSFHSEEYSLNLLGHAWKLWNEDKGLDLFDPVLEKSCHLGQLMRFINVGLLCVQEDATDRPTMSSIVLMLTSDSATLPVPKQPAYSFRVISLEVGSSSIDNDSKIATTNDVTISLLEAR